MPDDRRSPSPPQVENLFRGKLTVKAHCHGGLGHVLAYRPFQRDRAAEQVDFIDLVVVPPGATIGRHRHGSNREWYVILSNHGEMWLDGHAGPVGPGDIVVNPPAGEHGLRNTSEQPILLLVFQVSPLESPLDEPE